MASITYYEGDDLYPIGDRRNYRADWYARKPESYTPAEITAGERRAAEAFRAHVAKRVTTHSPLPDGERLAFADLPIVAVIAGVALTAEQEPALVFADGVKPLVLTVRNWTTLEVAFGNCERWRGKPVEVFAAGGTVLLQIIDASRLEEWMDRRSAGLLTPCPSHERICSCFSTGSRNSSRPPSSRASAKLPRNST